MKPHSVPRTAACLAALAFALSSTSYAQEGGPDSLFPELAVSSAPAAPLDDELSLPPSAGTESVAGLAPSAGKKPAAKKKSASSKRSARKAGSRAGAGRRGKSARAASKGKARAGASAKANPAAESAAKSAAQATQNTSPLLALDPELKGLSLPARLPAPPAVVVYEEVVVLDAPKPRKKKGRARPAKKQVAQEPLPDEAEAGGDAGPAGMDGGSYGSGEDSGTGSGYAASGDEEAPSGEPMHEEASSPDD